VGVERAPADPDHPGDVGAIAVALLVGALNSGKGAELAVAPESQCSLDDEADSGRRHGMGFTYSVNPPSGGNHAPVWVEPHRYPVGDPAPPDVELVHSLEHGYVVVWHQPYPSPHSASTLDRLRRAYPRDVLVVPRSSLEVPIAATAWHRRLLCDEVNVRLLNDFIKTYRNRGPERYRHY